MANERYSYIITYRSKQRRTLSSMTADTQIREHRKRKIIMTLEGGTINDSM